MGRPIGTKTRTFWLYFTVPGAPPQVKTMWLPGILMSGDASENALSDGLTCRTWGGSQTRPSADCGAFGELLSSR
jgi:hypothetical protein